MTKKTLAITWSLLISVMPFLGFPTEIKTIFYVVSGLFLVVLIELISIQGRRLARRNEESFNECSCYHEKMEISQNGKDPFSEKENRDFLD